MRRVAAGEAELVVEADAGGECEQAGGDAGAQSAEGARAVALEAEDVLEASKIDSMRWRRPEIRGAWPGSSLRLGRTSRAPSASDLREFGAGVALVGDDRLAASERSRQQALGDLALAAFGRPERGRARGAVGAASKCRRMPKK